MQRGDRGEGVG